MVKQRKKCPAGCDNGWVTEEERFTCPECSGSGRTKHGKCVSCNGKGYYARTVRRFCTYCKGNGTVFE